MPDGQTSLVQDEVNMSEEIITDITNDKDGMLRVRKKPVEVLAKQWFKDGDHSEVTSLATWLFKDDECPHCGNPWVDHGMIPTLEGEHYVCPGDWIIRGVKGEYYPCKPDIFEETYDVLVEE